MDTIVTPSHDNDNSGSKPPISPASGGRGPWMLMSYKNKNKINLKNAPANMKPVQSGSRYALLETFTEGEENALKEADPIAVEDLCNSTNHSEPPIISIWKEVQHKKKRRKLLQRPLLQTALCILSLFLLLKPTPT